jgi:hypothetical protein
MSNMYFPTRPDIEQQDAVELLLNSSHVQEVILCLKEITRNTISRVGCLLLFKTEWMRLKSYRLHVVGSDSA